MKHSIELLSHELNQYCDFYYTKKEEFNEELICLLCRVYRNKFDLSYNSLDQIKKDLKTLIDS